MDTFYFYWIVVLWISAGLITSILFGLLSDSRRYDDRLIQFHAVSLVIR